MYHFKQTNKRRVERHPTHKIIIIFKSDPVCPLRLECDQECATLERNRRLAEALEIDLSSDPFNARSTSVYSDSLKDDARSDCNAVSPHFLPFNLHLCGWLPGSENTDGFLFRPSFFFIF